jgi:hypothetical protein
LILGLSATLTPEQTADLGIALNSWGGNPSTRYNYDIGHAWNHGADFEFRFWPAPGARNDPRIVSMDDGPCGEVATARVPKMPNYAETEPFAPERVLELGSGGKILRRWAIPVDSTPYAVAGNDLFFTFDKTVYRVSLQGAVSLETSPPPADNAEEVECATPKEFLPSEYVGCWSFTDLRSKKPRVLAYEGVCS